MCQYKSLNGKVVLVTGGLGGIGQKIVNEFLKNGSIVYVNYNTSIKENVINREQCYFVQADLRISEEINTMFEQIKREQGKIDVLRNLL